MHAGAGRLAAPDADELGPTYGLEPAGGPRTWPPSTGTVDSEDDAPRRWQRRPARIRRPARLPCRMAGGDGRVALLVLLGGVRPGGTAALAASGATCERH